MSNYNSQNLDGESSNSGNFSDDDWLLETNPALTDYVLNFPEMARQWATSIEQESVHLRFPSLSKPMAKSREIPTPDPVNESETEESETEESGSESESESPLTTPAAAKLQKPIAKAAATAETSSDEESGSEYETYSESDSLPDTNGKPLPEKKPSSSAAAEKTPAKSAKAPATPTSGMKRSAETPSQDADTKRSKKAVETKEVAATEEGKKLFERVFIPEDLIIVLEELLKRYPMSNSKDSPQFDDFYECIKSKISVPASKDQVRNKIKKVRLQFFQKRTTENTNERKKKKKKKKEDTVEETMVYELCKKIWGNEEGPKSAVKGPTRLALKFEEAMGIDEKEEVSYASIGGPVNEWIFREGTKLVADEVKDELEGEWKKIRKEEARLFMQKLELTLKHTKAVYDCMSS